MATSSNLVWIDLETTGLVPSEGEILELGLRVTTPLGEVVNGSSWLIRPKRSEADLRGIMGPIAEKMHSDNGLIREVYERGHLLDNVIADATEWLGLNGLPSGVIPPSGANTPFDRSWLFEHGPDLAAWFHYRPGIDCSMLRSACRALNPNVFEHLPKVSDRHRVDDCLDGALAQYKFLLDEFLMVAI